MHHSVVPLSWGEWSSSCSRSSTHRSPRSNSSGLLLIKMGLRAASFFLECSSPSYLLLHPSLTCCFRRDPDSSHPPCPCLHNSSEIHRSPRGAHRDCCAQATSTSLTTEQCAITQYSEERQHLSPPQGKEKRSKGGAHYDAGQVAVVRASCWQVVRKGWQVESGGKAYLSRKVASALAPRRTGGPIALMPRMPAGPVASSAASVTPIATIPPQTAAAACAPIVPRIPRPLPPVG